MTAIILAVVSVTPLPLPVAILLGVVLKATYTNALSMPLNTTLLNPDA